MAIRISEVGYWSGIAATVATTTFVVVQLLQVAGAFVFPVDEILIYGSSLCIVLPFLLEMLAFHHLTRGDKRFWTHAAVLLTVVYAVFVTANYVVQLATVIPARLAGTADSMGLLVQAPHSMFWDFDAIGYIAMGLVALVAIPACERDGSDMWVRRAFIAHAAVTPLIAIVYFAPTFSTALLFLGFPWAITAPLFMGLLAVRLRKGPVLQ
jgi:hypothetical protein